MQGTLELMLSGGLAIFLWVLPALAEQRDVKVGAGGATSMAGPLEPVRGQGCWTLGDGETPAQAKKAARTLAEEQAVKSHRVYVQSSSTVKNFQLEDDLVQSASAAELKDVQIEKQEEKGREFCVTITAKLSPVKLEDLIRQKLSAKETAQTVQAPLLSGHSAFGLRVWTNKPGGSYVEGEPLIVSVQSDRDAHLKLDYFQADGTVVHLVPNVYAGAAFIKAGHVYSFGGPGGREAFTITGPFGAETLKAIASTQPFDDTLSSQRNADESRSYLRGLQNGLRGVKVGGTAAQWAEASVSLSTVAKQVVEHNCALKDRRGVTIAALCPQN